MTRLHKIWIGIGIAFILVFIFIMFNLRARRNANEDINNHRGETIGIVYDFKFGNAVMSPAQFGKYSRNFGLPIQVIRP